MDCIETAFTLSFGLYGFEKMSFVLLNALADFQHRIQTVLNDIVPHFRLIHLYGIIVHGQPQMELLSHLREVFERLWTAE